VRRVTALLAAAAAVVAFSLATPALACDGHKAEAAAVAAKADEAKPAVAEAKGAKEGCAKTAAEAAVLKADAEKPGCAKAGAEAAVLKANADKPGCAKGCAKKAAGATVAKNEEAKAAETK
jgi:hypothetical protein